MRLEVEPLSEQQLHDMLCAALDAERGAVECVSRQVFKRRHDWRGSRLFEKLAVRVGGEPFPALLLKYYQPADEQLSLSMAAEREASVYRQLLAGAELGNPRFFGHHRLNGSGAGLLLMEFVEGRRLKKFADEHTWTETARWLAAMHHRFSGANGVDAFPSLVRHDSGFLWTMATTATELAARSSTRAGALMDQVLKRYQRVVDPLTVEPATLVHGEFYCTNILVGKNGEDRRICAFDWETAAGGCAFLDLTCLVQQRRRQVVIDRARVIEAYLEARCELGGRHVSVAEAEAQMQRCRIQGLMFDIWTGVTCRHLPPEKIEEYAQRATQQLDALE